MKIKFFCRSFNKELYLLSKRLYQDAGYPCVRLTDQTADGYFLTLLKDQDCDIAINVDEDCFISDLDAVLALARRVEAEGWVNAGCSDAALGCPRGGNAMVTNPFFNVFNLKVIRQRLSVSQIRQFRYGEVRDVLVDAFHQYGPEPSTIRKDLKLGADAEEPYYNFFFWLLYTFPGKTLYLENRRHADGITTQLDFCLHTWFARFYHPFKITYLFEGNPLDIDQEKRIDAIISEAYQIRQMSRPQFRMMSRCGIFLDGLLRWSIKIPQRVANWPNKLKRKIRK